MIMKEEKGLIPLEEGGGLGRIVITEEQVQLIKNTVAVGATDDELKLFFFECRRRGVHPMDRLIYFVKRGQGNDAKATFQAGIDFMRSQAEGTGEYRGQDDVEFGPMVLLNGMDIKVPEWAKATVKRRDREMGELISTSATAYWNEFYPGEKMGFIWRKMPRVMLGKTAESQALRKAFPRQLAGLYSFEEMEQADIVEPTRPPVPMPQEKKHEGTAGDTVVTGIEQVTQKTGETNGKPWILYTIHAGEKYTTFDKKHAEAAKVAAEYGLIMMLTFTQTEKGRNLVSISENITRQPGEEG